MVSVGAEAAMAVVVVALATVMDRAWVAVTGTASESVTPTAKG